MADEKENPLLWSSRCDAARRKALHWYYEIWKINQIPGVTLLSLDVVIWCITSGILIFHSHISISSHIIEIFVPLLIRISHFREWYNCTVYLLTESWGSPKRQVAGLISNNDGTIVVIHNVSSNIFTWQEW